MHVRPLLLAPLLLLHPARAQTGLGDLRLGITDATGAPLGAVVELHCAANGYARHLLANSKGQLLLREVPLGPCEVEVSAPGFATASREVELDTPVPLQLLVVLQVAPVSTRVEVHQATPVIDPQAPSLVLSKGSGAIEQRVSSLPGRSLEDLVMSEPGWLYEGNAVLHPRGAEYQTQFVIDGIPLTDNRSPSFGPEVSADDLDSMQVLTAGYPAEIGRKLGGVVELNTRRQTDPGLHGEAVLSGGRYDTAEGYARAQYVHKTDTYSASAGGGTTSHYLNPVVPQNYTNTGTTGEFATGYTRALPGGDQLDLEARHDLSRFLIPDELLQAQAGQRQNGDNEESLGLVRWQHVLSQGSLLALSGMVRSHDDDLVSNTRPTPIAAFQHNGFQEGYAKASWVDERGPNEWKAGVEADSSSLKENFSYTITDPSRFDASTPATLSFVESRLDLEQGAWVEDTVRRGQWTARAGLRFDHYQLLVNQGAWSPRLALARSLERLHTVVHGAYDRIFQTPAFENILLSSSGAVAALNADFLRLPVEPSRGTFYEGGSSTSLHDRARLDVNLYRRDTRNYADDDQLLNTGVSYPIAFDRGITYGAEGRLTVLPWLGWSGFASYSYMVANVWLPVTGGLFLGDDAGQALSQFSGHIPASQDQRNTLRTRVAYAAGRHAWFAWGLNYDSGLPFEFEGTEDEALATYGPAVVSRIDFDRGRVRPQLNVTATGAWTLLARERGEVRLQVDGENLTDRLNVIDFGGLFSGNAIAPGRSVMLRLNSSF